MRIIFISWKCFLFLKICFHCMFLSLFIARMCACACLQCPRMLKRESETQQVELQTVVSCLWLQGIKLGPLHEHGGGGA